MSPRPVPTFPGRPPHSGPDRPPPAPPPQPARTRKYLAASAPRYRALPRPGPPRAQVARVCATSGGLPRAGEPAGPGSTRKEKTKARRGPEPEPRRAGCGLGARTYPRELFREPGPPNPQLHWPHPHICHPQSPWPRGPAHPSWEVEKRRPPPLHPPPVLNDRQLTLTVPGTRKCCSWY